MDQAFYVSMTFYSEETKSQYLPGLVYWSRTARMAALLDRWIKEGRAGFLMNGNRDRARVSGVVKQR